MARRLAAASCLALLSACATREETTDPPAPPHPAVRLTLPDDGGDAASLLDSLESFTARVDGDTARMASIQRTLDVGAGTTGLLSAWRSGSGWQRLHVDARGTGFRTTDTYWIQNDTIVAARLVKIRPGEPPAVEMIWFRGHDLFRWIDVQGRTRSREAQSTRTEVDMLRSRVADIIEALSSERATDPANRIETVIH